MHSRKMNIVFEKVEGTISETSYNISSPFLSEKIPTVPLM